MRASSFLQEFHETPTARNTFNLFPPATYKHIMQRILLFLFGLPLFCTAQIFTGTLAENECGTYHFCLKINPDSTIVYTEKWADAKKKSKCEFHTHRFFYAYGDIHHLRDSIYSVEFSGNAIFNFDLIENIPGKLPDYFPLENGDDVSYVQFDSIKPDRVLMRSLYSFRLRYDNGKDSVYHYSDLKRELPVWDTGSYERFSRTYAYHYNRHYFKPGSKLSISTGLYDPETGDELLFDVPYGYYPFFSWSGSSRCIDLYAEIHISNGTAHICREIPLRQKK
jgi:hypothetical protein